MQHLGRISVLSQNDRHLDANDVRALVARTLSKDDRQRVIGHLLGECEPCRARVREELVRSREESAAFDAAFDSAFDAAIAKSSALIGARMADLEAGARLWPGLRVLPPGRRLIIVRNSEKYRTPGVLEALLRDYREGLWRDPAEGLELAELGLAIAERLDRGRYRASWLADLHGEAFAIAANAKRLASCPEEAAQLLRQAARQLSVGSGDLLLEGQLLTYQGSHWQTLRRFERAARAFGRAEQAYRQVGELHLAARSLVARAEAIGYLRPAVGIRLLRRAIPDIDGVRDPHLELTAHHSLAWHLNDAGQGREARAEVGRSSSLYERFNGNAVASLARVWLQGRIDRSLHDLDQARRSFERAWEGFEELGMQIHLTMLSIDRAELKVAGGEFEGAAALLAKILGLVQSWGISRETLVVLEMLRKAVVARQVERASFMQASLVVRRTWVEAAAAGESA
jgi:tetratricopeptide (TPR) repeat protein